MKTSQSLLRDASSPDRGAIGRPGQPCCSHRPNRAQGAGPCPNGQQLRNCALTKGAGQAVVNRNSGARSFTNAKNFARPVRPSPTRQRLSSLCRYSRHLPPAGGSLSCQGSWREAPERLYKRTLSWPLCTPICTFVFSHGLFFHRKQFRSMVRMYLSSLSMVASKFSPFSTKKKSYFLAENRRKRRFFS